jgi:hypothetical protein
MNASTYEYNERETKLFQSIGIDINCTLSRYWKFIDFQIETIADAV